MFDWNAELENVKQRVEELEKKLFTLRDELRRYSEDPMCAPVLSTIERDRRLLGVRVAGLERAKAHQRFIEHKIALGGMARETLPFMEVAKICFDAAKWMPDGEAAKTVSSQGAALYTKAVTQRMRT
jgi:hypothetical protein